MLPNENIGSCIHFYLLTLLVGHSEQFPNFYLKRRDLSRRYKECLFKLTLSCSWNDIVLSVRFELRFFRYYKILNCYVVNTSALVYLPPNESGELLNINPHKESPHSTLPSISVKSMVYSPRTRAGYHYESSSARHSGNRTRLR